MIDLITGILTLVAALIAFLISKSFLIAILVAVAATLIVRSFKPHMQYALEKKYPSKQVKVIEETGTSSGLMLGMRLLLLTQNVTYSTEFEEDRERIKELFAEGLEKLKESNELFASKYAIVKEKDYPVQFSYGACGNSKTSIRMHYFQWIRNAGINNFNNPVEGKDIFTADLIIKDKKGEDQSALFQAVFDPKLDLYFDGNNKKD